jgi:hypothetical protein
MLLLKACRQPNRNCCFFEGVSKQSDVTTLNWGKGGSASFFAMSVTGWLDFWKNPVSLLKTLVEVDL